MRAYDKTTIAAAFSTVARLVREGRPVSINKIKGLSSHGRVAFRAAITHNFNKKDHGFDLQKIFIVHNDSPSHWTRNTNANDNPKDIELIDRILLAMRIVRRMNKGETAPAKTSVSKRIKIAKPLPNPEDFTDEELDNYISLLNEVKESRQARNTKKAELLKTVQSLIADEGFTIEELLDLV